MKENDIILLNSTDNKYISKNLYQGAKGIVLKVHAYNKLLVLFFNDKIVGDYAVVEVEKTDVQKENFELPLAMFTQYKTSKLLNDPQFYKKTTFNKLEFKECDFVELVNDDDSYSKYGIYKGETGVIAADHAVGDFILVDFTGVDRRGNVYGDCICVKIKDLKHIR